MVKCGIFPNYSIFLSFPFYTKPSSIKLYPNSLPPQWTFCLQCPHMNFVHIYDLPDYPYHFLSRTSPYLPPNVITASVALVPHTSEKFHFHICHMLLCYFFHHLVMPSFYTLSLISAWSSEDKSILFRLLNTDHWRFWGISSPRCFKEQVGRSGLSQSTAEEHWNGLAVHSLEYFPPKRDLAENRSIISFSLQKQSNRRNLGLLKAWVQRRGHWFFSLSLEQLKTGLCRDLRLFGDRAGSYRKGTGGTWALGMDLICCPSACWYLEEDCSIAISLMKQLMNWQFCNI